MSLIRYYENINVIRSPDGSGIPRFLAWIQRTAGGIVLENYNRCAPKKKSI